MKRCFYDRNAGTIFYEFYRENRDTIEVAIMSGGKVRVKAPKQMSEGAVRRFLKEKSGWIREQSENIRERQTQAIRKRFQDGSIFYYLGVPLRLSPQKARGKSVWRVERNLMIDRNMTSYRKRQEQLEKWYRKEAKENIESRVGLFSKQIGENPNKVTIKTQKKRWGSCSSLRNLNFNWKLIMMPQEIIDYVVVHELCHLKEMNHSKVFWNLVGEVLPDYRIRKEWLKNNAWKVEWEQI